MHLEINLCVKVHKIRLKNQILGGRNRKIILQALESFAQSAIDHRNREMSVMKNNENLYHSKTMNSLKFKY